MRVLLARYPQPIPSQPDAFARNDRFSRPQARPAAQRIAQIGCRINGREQRIEDRGPLNFRLQGLRRRTSRLFAVGDDRQLASFEAAEQLRYAIQTVDANRFQIGAQHGFHGAFPAALDSQLLSEAGPAVERVRLQPLRGLARGLSERRLLQSLGGDLSADGALPLGAQFVDRLRLFALAIASRGQFCEHLLQLRFSLLTRGFALRRLPAQLFQGQNRPQVEQARMFS